jgi:hypothetical protein
MGKLSHDSQLVITGTSTRLSQPFDLESDPFFLPLMSPGTPIVEVRARQAPIELDVARMRARQTHSVTLRELEGRVNSLPMNRPSKYPSVHTEYPNLYRPAVLKTPTCLSTLFD